MVSPMVNLSSSVTHSVNVLRVYQTVTVSFQFTRHLCFWYHDIEPPKSIKHWWGQTSFDLIAAEKFLLADVSVSKTFKYVINGDTDTKVHTFCGLLYVSSVYGKRSACMKQGQYM